MCGESSERDRTKKRRRNYDTRLYKHLKPYIKPLIVVIIVYSVAMMSIIRANYSYMDDNGRAISGYAWNFDFNRVSSSLLGYAMNVNHSLSDISPLPQLLAILFLSLASLIITKVFCRGKIKYPQLIASCFIGVTPFMYGCWVFKFDAPCMALSLLTSVMPLLVWNKYDSLSKKQHWMAFAVMVLCMLTMWTSYQASSGILPVFVVGLAVLNIVQGGRISDVLRKCLFYASAYLVGALLFKLLFPNSSGEAYRETNMYPLAELVPGVVNNIKKVLTVVGSSVNKYWLIMIAAIVIFYLGSCVLSDRRKLFWIKNLFVSVIGLGLMLILSYGAYLILQDAPVNGRSLVGVGAVLAIIVMIGLCIVPVQLKIALCLVSGLTVYSFVIYGLALGNALASQEKYADSRMNILITELIDDNIDLASNKRIRLNGDIGSSPVMAHVLQTYPVTKYIFDLQSGLNDLSYWGYYQLNHYYGVNLAPDEQRTIVCNDDLSSSRYYDIASDDEGNICVKIK